MSRIDKSKDGIIGPEQKPQPIAPIELTTRLPKKVVKKKVKKKVNG